jgi:hypothetical protein
MKHPIGILGMSFILLLTLGMNAQAQPKQIIEPSPEDFGIHALWPPAKPQLIAQPKQVPELSPDDLGIHALWPPSKVQLTAQPRHFFGQGFDDSGIHALWPDR